MIKSLLSSILLTFCNGVGVNQTPTPFFEQQKKYGITYTENSTQFGPTITPTTWELNTNTILIDGEEQTYYSGRTTQTDKNNSYCYVESTQITHSAYNLDQDYITKENFTYTEVAPYREVNANSSQMRLSFQVKNGDGPAPYINGDLIHINFYATQDLNTNFAKGNNFNQYEAPWNNWFYYMQNTSNTQIANLTLKRLSNAWTLIEDEDNIGTYNQALGTITTTNFNSTKNQTTTIFGYTDYVSNGYELDTNWWEEPLTITQQKITFTKGEERPITQEVINLPNLMFNILTLPFSFLSQAFNLTIFPGTPYQINISQLLIALLGILIVLFIVKTLTGIFK